MRGRQRGRHRWGSLTRWSRSQTPIGRFRSGPGAGTGKSTAAACRGDVGPAHRPVGHAARRGLQGFRRGLWRRAIPRQRAAGEDHRALLSQRFPVAAAGVRLSGGGLAKLGHTVEYCLEETPPADVYIFNPALMTLPYELTVIRKLNEQSPQTRDPGRGAGGQHDARRLRGLRLPGRSMASPSNSS